jgi:hypothetical protein
VSSYLVSPYFLSIETGLNPWFLFVLGMSCMSANCHTVSPDEFVLAHVSKEQVHYTSSKLDYFVVELLFYEFSNWYIQKSFKIVLRNLLMVP